MGETLFQFQMCGIHDGIDLRSTSNEGDCNRVVPKCPILAIGIDNSCVLSLKKRKYGSSNSVKSDPLMDVKKPDPTVGEVSEKMGRTEHLPEHPKQQEQIGLQDEQEQYLQQHHQQRPIYTSPSSSS